MVYGESSGFFYSSMEYMVLSKSDFNSNFAKKYFTTVKNHAIYYLKCGISRIQQHTQEVLHYGGNHEYQS